MKKTYLTWKTLFMVAILSVCFVSCSKDDDDNGDFGGDTSELVDQLQGTWQFVQGKETVKYYNMGIDPININMTRQDLENMKQTLEQSSGQRIEIWDATLRFNGNTVNGVEYKLDGKKIKFEGEEVPEGMDMSVSVKSISSSKMVLHEVFKIDMEGLKMDITADMEYNK